MDESRTDLLKYYKYVRVCTDCHKQFGLDTKDHYKTRCPLCSDYIRRLTDKKKEVNNVI